MPAADRQRSSKGLRRLGRGCRRVLLLTALVLVLGLVYLNQIGFPGFLKTRLRAELGRHGVDLQFERLRLRWWRGIVAEAVTLGPTAQAAGPQLQLGEVALRLDTKALLHHQLKVDALGIYDGRLRLPLQTSNQPPLTVTLEQITAELRFLPEDQWELDQLEARFMGAKLRVNGSVAHATETVRWRLPAAATNQPPSIWRQELRQFVEIYRRLRFTLPPTLALSFRGDARDPASFTAKLTCQLAGARTPWGKLQDLRLVAQMNQPAPTNDFFHTSLHLTMDGATTPWGNLRHGRFTILVAHALTNGQPARVNANLSLDQVAAPHARLASASLSAQSFRLAGEPPQWQSDFTVVANQVETDWGQASSNRLSGWFLHSATNWTPFAAQARLRTGRWDTRWATAKDVRANLDVTHSAQAPTSLAQDLGWWRALVPFQVDWHLQAGLIAAQDLSVTQAVANGHWAAPELVITNLAAELGGGGLQVLESRLDVATRALTARARFDLDAHQLGGVLPTNAQRWLDQFSWRSAPRAVCEAKLTLPPWTQAAWDWRAEVLPSVVLEGLIEGQNAAYRGLPVNTAQVTVSFSNLVWRLPSLILTRPEGTTDLAYRLDTRTQEFHWQFRGRIDPQALQPLLDPGAQKGLADFTFNGPAAVAGDVWGCWLDRERLGFAGQIAATNFSFRGEQVDEFGGELQYTNSFLAGTNLKLRHGDEWIDAPSVGLSLTNYWVFLTNAQSSMDPFRITRVIGEKTTRAIEPYRFLRPPHARVNGHVPAVGSTDTADLRFELSGGPFHYWRFNLPEVAATVHWVGNALTITNLDGAFYQGRLQGNMAVDFTPVSGAEFRFELRSANTDLHQLLADVTNPTNRLEGTLDVYWAVTRANSSDWKSWMGFGNVRMRDGKLWDSPLFGLFSPMLNRISPGLGNSRAKAAEASFTVNRSIIYTDDLQIHASPVLLAYHGTVDFDGNVHARVEAELLRSAPLVGPLITLATKPLSKLFEYKVTGTLANPVSEPLYIPKFIDALLHPLRTLKRALPLDAVPKE